MKKFVIKKEYSGYKIADYLKEVEGYSSRSMRKIEVFLNGKRVKISKKIRYLNRLGVKEKEKGTNILPIEIPLDIVYEDENILLINKQPNLITHPTLKKVDKTLANGVVYYLKEKYSQIMVPRFYNRLDMDTTGIIVLTKNSFAQSFLQKHGEVEKYYMALVKGIVKEDEFIINEKIGRSEEKIQRIICETGQEAKTAVKVLDRNTEKNISLLELRLFTGRTHQIRVHLSHIGHPILGDKLYGGEYEGVERQLLHSYKLSFINPNTKKKETVEIPLYKDMKLF